MLSATAQETSLGKQRKAKAAEPEAITAVDTIEDSHEGYKTSTMSMPRATAQKYVSGHMWARKRAAKAEAVVDILNTSGSEPGSLKDGMEASGRAVASEGEPAPMDPVVKDGIVPADDGRVAVFVSMSLSPSLLGAEACGVKGALAIDTPVAKSGAEVLLERIFKKHLVSPKAPTSDMADSHKEFPQGDANWIVPTSRNKTKRKRELESTKVCNMYDLLDLRKHDEAEVDELAKKYEDKDAASYEANTESSGKYFEETKPTSTPSHIDFGVGSREFFSSKLLCIVFSSIVVLGLCCSAFALSSYSDGVSELLDSVFVPVALLDSTFVPNATALPAEVDKFLPDVLRRTASTRQGMSSTATSGKRFVASQVRTFDGSRLWDAGSDLMRRVPHPLQRPWSRCARCAVVTTINPPSAAIDRIVSSPGWCLIIVGDQKTGDAAYEALSASHPESVRYLSYKDQLALPYEIVAATPSNHFARKNLGYLYAINAGAKTVFDFDDDNELVRALPASASAAVRASVPRVARRKSTQGDTGPSFAFVNAYARAFGSRQMWPRGLPLDAIDTEQTIIVDAPPDEDIDVGVAQSLADNDPDVDAIYRLGPRAALPLPWAFPTDAMRALVLDERVVCPFNAQAALFDDQALWALLLPASVHGRVADIWRGYIAQRVFELVGLRLAFVPPLVQQVRNSHDPMSDYMSERPLYETARAFATLLHDAPLANASSVEGALESIYILLYEHGFLELTDVHYLQLWITDLHRLHAPFPRPRPSPRRARVASLSDESPSATSALMSPMQMVLNTPRSWLARAAPEPALQGTMRVLYIGGRGSNATTAAHTLAMQLGRPMPTDYMAAFLISAPHFNIEAKSIDAKTLAADGAGAKARALNAMRYDAVIVQSWDPCHPKQSAHNQPIVDALEALRNASQMLAPRVIAVFEGYSGQCDLSRWKIDAAFVLSFENAHSLRTRHPTLPFILRMNLGVVSTLSDDLDSSLARAAGKQSHAVCFLGQHREREKSKRVICGLASAMPDVTFLIDNDRNSFLGCEGNPKNVFLPSMRSANLENGWGSCSVQLDFSWRGHTAHHTNTKVMTAAVEGRVPVVEEPTNTMAAALLFGKVVAANAGIPEWTAAIRQAMSMSYTDRMVMRAHARTIFSWSNTLLIDLVDLLYTLRRHRN